MYQDGLVGVVVKTVTGSVPNFGVSAATATPIRVYTVHIISGATAGQVKLYNGTSTSGTLYAHMTCPMVSSGNTFDFGVNGLLFPNGCFYSEVTDADVVSTAITYYGTGYLSSSSCSSSSSSSCRSSSSSSCSSCSSSSSSSCRSSSSSCSSSCSSSSSCRSSSSSSLSSSSSCRSSSSSSANP